jgi:hypothetical protein
MSWTSSAAIELTSSGNFFPRSFWFRDRIRAAAQRKSAVTVELDFVDPITGGVESTSFAFIGSTKSGRRAEDDFTGA